MNCWASIATLRRRWCFRRKCAMLLATLPVVNPFDIHVFCNALAAQRDRPIILRPRPLRGQPYGWVGSTPTADIIYYEQHTSRIHQEQIILHEVAHLLLDHCPSRSQQPMAAQILPDLPTTWIASLRRCGEPTDEDDREAEDLASKIRARAASLQIPAQISEPQLIEALTRLQPFHRQRDRE